VASSEIRNGEVVTPARKGHVVLSGGCSGTLITGNWVLTAAHCVNLHFNRLLNGGGLRAAPHAGALITSTLILGGRTVLAGRHVNARGEPVFYLSAINALGNRDDAFGTQGQVFTDLSASSGEGIEAVALQGSKILAAGWATVQGARRFAVARYTSAGQLDTSFGNAGVRVVDFVASGREEAYGVAVDAEDRVVLVGRAVLPYGRTGDRFALARLTENGGLDSAFGAAGQVITDPETFAAVSHGQLWQVAIDDAGRLLTRGTAYAGDRGNHCAVRYTARGAVDTGYGTRGLAHVPLTNPRMAVRGSEAVFAGSADGGLSWVTAAQLMRLDAAGQRDLSFGNRGTATVSFHQQTSAQAKDVAISADGRIRVAAAVQGEWGAESRFGFATLSASGQRVGHRYFAERDGFTFGVLAGDDYPIAMSSYGTRFAIVGAPLPRAQGVNYPHDPERVTSIATVFPDRSGVWGQSWLSVTMGAQRDIAADYIELGPDNLDVALVELTSPMALDYARFRGFHPNPAELIGSNVTCYGYGYDGSDGLGVLRRGTLRVRAVTPISVEFTTTSSDQMIRPGDSGGACFDDRGRIVAVNSRAGGDRGEGIRGDRLADWVSRVVP
jgi:uncharacterized delta-60 repeat protein